MAIGNETGREFGALVKAMQCNIPSRQSRCKTACLRSPAPACTVPGGMLNGPKYHPVNADIGRAKPMQLLIVYAVLVVIGQAAAIGVGRMVETTYPGASLFTFLGLFFVVLFVAWRLALRLTPK
jgi:hypothetical protein